MILCPHSKMDKNGQHGCFTPSILSIVICSFVRYKIPLQKAHVICKIINVQNDTKLAHTNVRAIKSTVGYSERSSILTASEKHPPYKVFDYSVKIYFARYHTPLKNFMDNPPIHNKKDKQMFVKHLPPARSEYRVPQRPITKTGTKEGQLTQRYY